MELDEFVFIGIILIIVGLLIVSLTFPFPTKPKCYQEGIACFNYSTTPLFTGKSFIYNTIYFQVNCNEIHSTERPICIKYDTNGD
jgi:hypothetical protein